MKNVLKKILCLGTAVAIAVPSMFMGVFAENTAANAKAEKSFFEDFEKYQTVVHYNSSNYVNNAKPQNGDYSDTEVYPNGTASVYEGNAMNNVAVKDAAGNDIYGGLDGWYGFYNGASGAYNKSNRRLSVGAYAGKGDINSRVNASHTLKFEPHKTNSATASLNRNNVDISNYSFLSSRVSLSGTDIFGKAAVALTVNPQSAPNAANNDTMYDSLYDLVTFESGANAKEIDIKFNSATLKTVTLSEFQTANSSQWYTVEIRLMNNPNETKAKVDIYDDNNDIKLCGTAWTVLSGFNYNSASKYGIRFYAQSTEGVSQPRMLLDDVKFTKDSFSDNFDTYSSTEKTISDGVTKIANGAKGNKNVTEIYGTDGVVYEGNMARNNFVWAVTGKSGTNYTHTDVYGNVPFWQAYISNVDTKDAYNATNRTCAIYKLGYGALANQNALHLNPKFDSTNQEKTIYAGMESADFDGNTQWKSTVSFYNAGSNNGYFKLQLTSGRNKTTADIAEHNNGTVTSPATSYTDSLKSYDVLTFADGKIYKGADTTAAPVAEYEAKSTNAYDVTYVVDRQGDTPKEKILIKNGGVTVYESNFTDMTFTNDGFAFDKNVTGFRYVAYTGNSSGNAVLIDNVEINKYFSTNVADSGISAAKVSIGGVVDAIVNLPDAGECQIIAAIYDDDGNMVSIGYKGAMSRGKGYNPTSITMNNFPTDYASGDYTLKLFCWDGLKAALKPIMAEYTLK